MRIIWAERTKADIKRIHDFLEKKNPATAIKAIQTIQEKTNQLAQHPQSGTLMDSITQRRELHIRFGKYGYTIRYVYDSDAQDIFILRVWHGREIREPN